MRTRKAKPKRPTWADLAVQLGVATQTLHTWRKREDAPRGYDLDEWLAYCEDKGLGVAANKAPADINELRKAKLTAEVRRLTLQNEQLERKLVPADEIERLHLTVATRLKQHLYATFESELPIDLEGKRAGEIRDRLVAVADEMCGVFQHGVEAWQNGA